MKNENLSLCYWKLAKDKEDVNLEKMLKEWISKCNYLEQSEAVDKTNKQVKYMEDLRIFLDQIILCEEINQACLQHNFLVKSNLSKSHLEMYLENTLLNEKLAQKNKLILSLINKYLEKQAI